MLNNRKKIDALLCFLLLCLGLMSCNGSNLSSNPATPVNKTVPTEKRMVVLGDSIAAGFGLDNPDTQSYSALFAAACTTDDTVWTTFQYAVSGDTSTLLRKRLSDGRAVRLPSADLITVCIGANNLLGPYGQFLATYAAKTSNPATIVSAFSQMEADCDAGLQDLKTDLPALYQWIREKNADATVVFLNLYNPYADFHETLTIGEQRIDFSDYAQEKVDALNAVITQFAKDEGLAIVDVEQAFAACDTTPINGIVASQTPLLADPHPNAEGHRIIAETLITTLGDTIK